MLYLSLRLFRRVVLFWRERMSLFGLTIVLSATHSFLFDFEFVVHVHR